MQSKKCTRCKKIKSIRRFKKHSAHKDGLCSWCKNCCIEDYHQNRERHLAYKKKTRSNPEYQRKEVDYKNRYRQKNKIDILKYNKEYCQKNPEWTKQQARLYYWRHREERLIKVKEYKANNRTLYNELDRKRRNLKNNLPTTLTEKEWIELLNLYGYSCYYCGKKVDQLEKEHKIPLSKNGGYTKENIVPACRSCNAKKHTLTEIEFMERQAII